MPREELDVIQGKLKLAIQNHQNVVCKLKTDPQNEDHKSTLRDLQSQITSLSDQQRTVVQKLRNNLIQETQTTDLTTHQPQPAHQQSRGPPAAHTGSPPLVLHSPLSTVFGGPDLTNPPPADLSLKSPKSPTKTPTKPPLKLRQIAPQPVAPQPTEPPQKLVVPSPLRVPDVTSYKTSDSLDKPLYINTSPSQFSPQVTKDLTPKTSCPQIIRPTPIHPEKKMFKDKKKLDFMATIDLGTLESVKELQAKRLERKRRNSNSNPQFTYNGEPEKKRIIYLMSPPSWKRSWKNSKSKAAELGINEECCECHLVPSDPLMCGMCYDIYHVDCVKPALASHPPYPWSCPKCELCQQTASISAENLNVVHTYIQTKAVREEEKRKLQRQSISLCNEKIRLERKSRELAESLGRYVKEKNYVMSLNKNAEHSVNNLKNFVKIFQS